MSAYADRYVHMRVTLASGREAAALDIARDVADRLRDPRRVEAAAARASQQTSHPEVMHWQPHGVAQGFAGLSLLWGYFDRCFPGEKWDVLAHDHLKWATHGGEVRPMPAAGAFAGLSGLAFAAWYLSQDGRRYQRLLAEVDRLLVLQVAALAADGEVHAAGCDVSCFDVISGLSGIGAYLLCRRDRPECVPALDLVLRHLIELTKEDDGVPRWYTPHACLTEEWQAEFPGGNLNCGLAHGIPGPMALLSLAVLHDIRVDGIDDAIDRIAGWLTRHRADDEWGPNWPYAVPLAGADGIEPALEPSRTAWCYGTPGIARALWLAGEALDDSRYRQLAIAAMRAVLNKPSSCRGIDSATFCHGVAGLLQVVLRFARDTALPEFAESARELTGQLVSLYRPDRPLGYCSLDMDGTEVDNPGLLDGVPGVALVLLAAATGIEPAWDRLFLLS